MKAISRQSKTLMGIALLALGIYLWFNYLVQNNSSLLSPVFGNNQEINSVNSSSNSALTKTPIISNSTTNTDTQNVMVVAPLSATGKEIQVVGPNMDLSATTAAREVIIVDLPFLVTEPPAENLENADALENSISENQHTRVTVNPFSPIIITEDPNKNQVVNANQRTNPSVQTVVGQPRPASQPMVEQAKPTFRAPTELIKSTPLRTVTPAPSLANNLPTNLSRGTLSATPGILRNQNVVPPLASEVAAAKKAAEEAAALAEKARLEQEAAAAIAAAKAEEAAAAAVAAPENTPVAPPEITQAKLPVLKNSTIRTPHTTTANLAIISSPAPSRNPAALPGLLQSGRDAEQIKISTEQVETESIAEDNQDIKLVNNNVSTTVEVPTEPAAIEEPNISGGPIEAGVSELTRYLRDYNFEYTGSVIGAVRSVGMFRTNVSATPITITLGQNIPKTDIVLTNLQNNQAEFTKGQDKVILNLDLRR